MKILNRLNFYLMLVLAIINGAAMFVSPVLFWLGYSKLCFLILLTSMLFTNTLWALIHEGIHSNLNSNLETSNIYGRVLAILLHSNFEVLKFGHLMHHRYNRTKYDLTEGLEGRLNCEFQSQNVINLIAYKLYKLRRVCTYYFHITMGIYLVELVTPWLLLLPTNFTLRFAKKIMGEEHPYLINAQKILIKPDKIHNIRIDNLINLVAIVCIATLYQNYIWIYLIYLLIRAFLISSVDNLPHYGASLDRIDGAFNLRTPKWWQRMILNFNFHRVHHKHPYLPWHLLPEKFLSDAEVFQHDYFKHYGYQWRGVIEKEKLHQIQLESID